MNEFKQLAPAIKSQLPEYFTEKAELELSYAEREADETRKPVIEAKAGG